MKEFFENIKQTFKEYKWPIIGILTFILLEQILGIFLPYVSGHIIDMLSEEGGTVSFVPIALVISGFFFLLILGRLFGWFREKIDLKSFNFDFEKSTFENAIFHHFSLSGGQHIRDNSHKRGSTLRRGVGAIVGLSQMFFYEIIPNMVQVLVVLVALFIVSTKIAIIVFVAFSVNIGLQIMVTKKMMGQFDKWQKLMREEDKVIGEHMRNILLAKNFAQEAKSLENIDSAMTNQVVHGKKLFLVFTRRLTWIYLIIPITSVIVLFILAWGVYSGSITVGQFIFTSMWAGMAFNRIGMVQYYQRRIMNQLPAYRDLKKQSKETSDITIIENPIHNGLNDGKVEFKDVSYFYDDDDEGFGLRKVNFSIQAGQKIGIVGISGSGKTTLIRLLMRNFDPKEGQIFIDGNDLRLLDLKDYLSQVGYVDQRTQMFDETVNYNLSYGLNKKPKIKDLDVATKIANLYEKINDHPKKYKAKIGEQGIRLSGGENQRLAIARAVIKKPKILVFDEATSNLDTKNEKEIQDALDNASAGRTTIIIAHRLSTIQNADKILFFEKGNLVAEGTHKELFDRVKNYKELCEQQILIN